MASRSLRKQEELSRNVRETLALVGGIVNTTINEDGQTMGSYTLGIDIVKLKTLIDNRQFITYSFNLNDKNGVTLVGKV
jgi:hypothetical protein